MGTGANLGNISELIANLNLANDFFAFMSSVMSCGDVNLEDPATKLDFDTSFGRVCTEDLEMIRLFEYSVI